MLFDLRGFTFIFNSLLCSLFLSFSIKQVTVATQTGHESPDLAFNAEKMTTDKHCYECKVRYKDPKPQDLVMYLHAWKYKVNFSMKHFFLFLLMRLAQASLCGLHYAPTTPFSLLAPSPSAPLLYRS